MRIADPSAVAHQQSRVPLHSYHTTLYLQKYVQGFETYGALPGTVLYSLFLKNACRSYQVQY